MILPANRHLLVSGTASQGEDTDQPEVLLPEGFAPKAESEHKLVKILALAPDCKSLDTENCVGHLAIVPSHMIINVNVKGNEHSLVQENYVLAVYAEEK